MLILTLTSNDPVTIGDVTVRIMSPGQVRVAIDAPRSVPIQRKKAKRKPLRE